MAPRPVIEEPEHPWERQNGETDAAWEAFVVYRDDPSMPRSVRRTARALAKNSTTVRDWSAEYGWVMRAAEFDAYLDRQRVIARVAEIKAMEQRHAQIAQAAMGVLTMPFSALARPRRVPSKDGREAEFVPRQQDLDETSTHSLIRLAQSSASILAGVVGVERLARGEATEILAVSPGEAGGDTGAKILSDEERVGLLLGALEESGDLLSEIMQRRLEAAPIDVGPGEIVRPPNGHVGEEPHTNGSVPE